MRGFIVGTAVTAIAFYVLTKLLPDAGIYDGVTYDGELVGLVVLAVIFGLVNGFVGPAIKTLAIPISLVTMGLVGFLINAALFLVTALIADFDRVQPHRRRFPAGPARRPTRSSRRSSDR